MALCPYTLLMCCIITVITGDISHSVNDTTKSETTTPKFVPNDNIGENSDVILITTFFDLLWYIIGLIVFCICCISCLLLFYIQQTRKHDDHTSKRSKNSISESIPDSLHSGTLHRKSTLSATSGAISVTSITQSPSKSPLYQPSLPTLTHSKNPTYSNYSLSAFSGVDSEGIDLDETVNAFSEYSNVFRTLAPISEDINIDKHMRGTDDEETSDDDTTDDDTTDDTTDDMESSSKHHKTNNVEDSTESTESSIDNANMTILSMMKQRQRALIAPPVSRYRNINGATYKNKYAQTIESEIRELEQEIV